MGFDGVTKMGSTPRQIVQQWEVKECTEVRYYHTLCQTLLICRLIELQNSPIGYMYCYVKFRDKGFETQNDYIT